MEKFYMMKGMPQKRRSFFAGILSAVLFTIGGNVLHAQVSSYAFQQSNGTFTPVTGGTVLGTATGNTSTTNLNSAIYPVTLPFAFQFNGQSYSALNVSTNGFITFGATTPIASYSTPISGSTAYEGAVSAFGRDISSFFNVAGQTGDIRWETIGTAPNREVVIQWTNFRPTSVATITTVYSFSFQIRLQETSNKVAVVYSSGSYLVGSTSYSSAVNQVGLRGATNTDFNNRFNDTSTSYNSSAAGTANGDDQAFHTVNATPGMPASGLTYTWTPPSCYLPSSLQVTPGSPTTSSGVMTWTSSASTASGYELYYSTTNVAPTASTVLDATNSVSVSGTTATISGLTPLTTYYVWIRTVCSSTDKSIWSPVAITLSTLCSPPAITGTSVTPTPVCLGGTATLTAAADAAATVYWYADASTTTPLSTGPTYTTPVLTATTSYWVSAGVGSTGTVGKDVPVSTSTNNGFSDVGLMFDAFSNFTLVSVDVYPVSTTSTSGTVTIALKNSAGVELQSYTANVTVSPTGALNTIPLNFAVPSGIGHRLVVTAASGMTGLIRESSTGFAYPYILPGFASINSAYTSGASNLYYYYLYNWSVSAICESARTMVTATYDSTCTMGTSEADSAGSIKVYPNPFTDVVNISDAKDLKSVSVLDMSGRMVKSVANPGRQLNLGELKSGIYILKLDFKEGLVQNIKVIKK